MKYVLLIHSNPARWVHPMFLHQHEELAPAERDARISAFDALLKEITESGELVDSAALADPLTTRTVRHRDDALTVTDGPFADAKEHLAGYFVVECDSIERAVEIASRFPDTQHSPVEVRPIMDLSGMEM